MRRKLVSLAVSGLIVLGAAAVGIAPASAATAHPAKVCPPGTHLDKTTHTCIHGNGHRVIRR
jgi:hypothetical protein